MIKKDLALFKKVINEIKETQTVKEMFDKAGVSLEVIHYVPMCFSPLEVSARTQHGIIYFNEKLREKPEEIAHYAVHELTHVLQQCFSDGPTTGSTEDSYLDNPYEIEGFNNQTKFLSEEKGDHIAEKYIDKVLNHHDVDNHEKDNKKQELLEFASKKQLKFDFEKEEPITIEMVNDLFDKIENTTEEEFFEKNKHRFHKYYKLLPSEKSSIKDNADKIISIIEKNISKKAGVPQVNVNIFNKIFSWIKKTIDKRIYTISSLKLEKIKNYNLNQAKKIKLDIKKYIQNLQYFTISDLDNKIFKIDVEDLLLIISKNQDSTYDIFYDDKKFLNLNKNKLENILYGKVDLITKLMVRLTDMLNKVDFIIDSHSNLENIVEINRLINNLSTKEKIILRPIEVMEYKYDEDSLFIKLFFNNKLYEAAHGGNSRAYFAFFEGPDIKDVYYTISIDTFCDNIGNIDDYNQFILEISDALKHELLHLEQTIFNINYPFKKIKVEEDGNINLEKEEHSEKYELLDVEFYPLLIDEISEFKNVYKNIENKEILSILAKKWTGNNLNPLELYKIKMYNQFKSRLFFKKLKDKDFEKYKKAVREFIKAVIN